MNLPQEMIIVRVCHQEEEELLQWPPATVQNWGCHSIATVKLKVIRLNWMVQQVFSFVFVDRNCSVFVIGLSIH